MWWAMFDRHAMTEEELVQDMNSLGALRRLSQSPEPIKRSQGFWYGFDPDQDTKLDVGARCYSAHDLEMKIPVHAVDQERGRICLKFSPQRLKQLPDGLPPDSLSLIPDEYVSARVIENAVRDIAQTWKEENRLPSALDDFLLRRPPRLQLQSPTDDGALIDPNEDLSRAQSLAIVVASPALARTRCQTLAHMERVNLFCRVMEEGEQ